MSDRQAAALVGVLIVTLVASLPSLWNHFVYDDHDQILANPILRNWSTLWKCFAHDSWWSASNAPGHSYYRPLQIWYLLLNFKLFGTNPMLWHAAKIALHLVAILVAFRAVQLLADDTAVALLAALLFGLLPCYAEAVAWISVVSEPLAAIFELGAICLLIEKPPGVARRAGSLLLFAASLFSYEGAISCVAIVASYGFLIASFDSAGSRPTMRMRLSSSITIATPYLAVTVVYFAVRMAAIGTAGFRLTSEHIPIVQSIVTTPSAVWMYVKVIALPWEAGPIHRVLWVDGFGDAGFGIPLAILVALASGFYFAVRNSTHRNLYLFCSAWFVFALVPTLYLGPISGPYPVVQDRYLCLAALGPCVILADVLTRSADAPFPKRLVAYGASTAIAAVYAAAFWNAQGFWRTDVTLWERSVKVFPDCLVCRELLAQNLERNNDLTRAEREYRELVRLEPDRKLYRFYLALIQQRLSKSRTSK